MRQVMQTCEIEEPVHIDRALRGSSRGSIQFELDFRRHYRPTEVPDPGIPAPVLASFQEAPQPPVERLVYLKMAPPDTVPVPTIPWGTLPPPAPPTTAPALLEEEGQNILRRPAEGLGPAG